jgi:hypothetical protein
MSSAFRLALAAFVALSTCQPALTATQAPPRVDRHLYYVPDAMYPIAILHQRECPVAIDEVVFTCSTRDGCTWTALVRNRGEIAVTGYTVAGVNSDGGGGMTRSFGPLAHDPLLQKGQTHPAARAAFLQGLSPLPEGARVDTSRPIVNSGAMIFVVLEVQLVDGSVYDGRDCYRTLVRNLGGKPLE